MANKYVSPSRLGAFLENLKTIFAPLLHSHSVSDLEDYTVDDALSATSTNPVQNAVLNAEFDAIGDAMGALELSIDTHTHTVSDLSDLTVTAGELNLVSGVTSNVQGQLDVLTSRIFIGTYEEYQTANANNEIPINAIVIITDDGTSGGGDTPGGSDDPTSSTTAMLGYAVLGQMILG